MKLTLDWLITRHGCVCVCVSFSSYLATTSRRIPKWSFPPPTRLHHAHHNAQGYLSPSSRLIICLSIDLLPLLPIHLMPPWLIIVTHGGRTQRGEKILFLFFVSLPPRAMFNLHSREASLTALGGFDEALFVCKHPVLKPCHSCLKHS